ncbi:MAG: aspartate carbamoyltransferase catalytic subunit, partial [Oscillospiraceae bacterium]|nr:aspartate carbamoyltransferase catalytic subunit [Oscillospiraceae bacterium]
LVDEGMKIKARLKRGEKNFSDLEGKSAVTLFYENSTRTRCSFDLAAKNLRVNVVNLGVATSSVQKGETLIDTGRTLDMQQNDFMVIRHPVAGAPNLLAKNVKAHVINAGDGMNEHPTQALLDFLTMKEHFGKLDGLRVAILGDVSHSRVAKSNLFGLKKLGSEVRLFAPRTLLPTDIGKMGAKVCAFREEAVEGADVVMGLRIQLERQRAGAFPSLGEYAKYYGVNDEILRLADKDAIVMHPAPVNRGVELTSSVIDGEQSRIEEQVFSGLAVRMAVFKALA